MTDTDLGCAHGNRNGECPFLGCPHFGEPWQSVSGRRPGQAPRRRDDPEWVPSTLGGEGEITSMTVGGLVMVPDGWGGFQPLPDDWEEQNGWPRPDVGREVHRG